jgi:hypothetical protein
MHNITLITTAHKEFGVCNSDELCKIMESLKPEVIFEEMDDELYNRYYLGNQLLEESLEVKSIKKYLKNHDIKHVPVDIDVSPDLSTREIDYLFDTLRKYAVYNRLEQEQILLTQKNGFAFLNSNECSKIFEEKIITEIRLIEFDINKNLLLHIHKLFYEEHDNREKQMLHNIYNYSKENQYDQAVFLIGSGHRNSIIKKITESETKNPFQVKLNWTFYNE